MISLPLGTIQDPGENYFMDITDLSGLEKDVKSIRAELVLVVNVNTKYMEPSGLCKSKVILTFIVR